MMNRSSFTFIATFVVVLIVCLSSRTNAKGFECKKGKDSSPLLKTKKNKKDWDE